MNTAGACLCTADAQSGAPPRSWKFQSIFVTADRTVQKWRVSPNNGNNQFGADICAIGDGTLGH